MVGVYRRRSVFVDSISELLSKSRSITMKSSVSHSLNAFQSRSVEISIISIGVLFLAFGTVSNAITYQDSKCGSISNQCGTYTSCAQYFGTCTSTSSNPGVGYNSLINQNLQGGGCYDNPNTTCTMKFYTCTDQYYKDSLCKTAACTSVISNPYMCQ